MFCMAQALYNLDIFQFCTFIGYAMLYLAQDQAWIAYITIVWLSLDMPCFTLFQHIHNTIYTKLFNLKLDRHWRLRNVFKTCNFVCNSSLKEGVTSTIDAPIEVISCVGHLPRFRHPYSSQRLRRCNVYIFMYTYTYVYMQTFTCVHIHFIF